MEAIRQEEIAYLECKFSSLESSSNISIAYLLGSLSGKLITLGFVIRLSQLCITTGIPAPDREAFLCEITVKT